MIRTRTSYAIQLESYPVATWFQNFLSGDSAVHALTTQNLSLAKQFPSGLAFLEWINSLSDKEKNCLLKRTTPPTLCTISYIEEGDFDQPQA